MSINVRENVILIQQKISQLRKSGLSDPLELEMKIINDIPKFYDDYPFLIKRLCREEEQDNTMLFKMIDLLEQVGEGQKSMESVELKLGKELANKYIYPVIDKEKK